jgi:hypothetical protein
MMTTSLVLCGLLAGAASMAYGADAPVAAAGANIPELPELNWEQRSDWIDVKTDVTPRAVGDGKADDTAALQTAFDRVREPGSAYSTVYLPPGTYRITSEIYPKHARQDAPMHLRGHGRSTRIVWDGPAGGRMFRSDSGAYSTYIGVVWDGRNLAAQGLIHSSIGARETKVLHQHQAFMNFTEQGSGTARGKPDQRYLEGSEWRNCLFVNSGKALAIWDFNDYVITINGCEFHGNDYGIWSERGNFYARNCHFRGSRQADMVNANDTHGSSARRCTSVGSRAFYERGGSSGTLFTMQDCHVSGWTHPDHAVLSRERARSPMLIFDCTFTEAPSTNPPIRLEGSTPVVHSNNKWTTGGELAGGRTEQVREIPPGRRGGSVASAQQSFFQSEASIPAKVFDAKRDFGAKGDGRSDDTDAVQRTIDATRQHGVGAIAYLPRGKYLLTKTIDISGGNYHVGGAGCYLGNTAIMWGGSETGPVFLVANPQNVTLENLGFWINHQPATLVAIRQESNTPEPSRMHYEQLIVAFNRDGFTRKNGCIEVLGLPKDSVLTAGNVRIGRWLFDEASRARILISGDGLFRIRGTQAERDGFLGVQTSQGSFLIEDNQSLVGSDSYVEQGKHEYARLRGTAGLPEGRVTLSSPRLHTWGGDRKGWDKDFIIEDYRGTLASVMAKCDSASEPQAAYQFAQTGSEPFNIVCLANSYAGAVPTFEVGPDVSVTVLNCRSGKEIVPDVLHANSLRLAAQALDHFRDLGAYDLELNHADKLVNRTCRTTHERD